MGTKAEPKEQVTVRLRADLVAFMDQSVEDGVFATRAAFLNQAAERQRRYQLALHDIAILSSDHDKDDLHEIALWNARRPLDLD
jgi:Arc/MetJ-type ribon-helix-helix transcriptional regulator